jgi:glutamyl-tRNA reductase
MKRMEAVPEVKNIIHQELQGFKDWSKELSISPTIHLLKDALENLRKEEIARHLRNMDEKELRLVDEVTKNLMQKIMKLPVLQLKEACKRGEAENLVEVLHSIFNLESLAQAKQD